MLRTLAIFHHRILSELKSFLPKEQMVSNGQSGTAGDDVGLQAVGAGLI
jgi:hypothetical protein